MKPTVFLFTCNSLGTVEKAKHKPHNGEAENQPDFLYKTLKRLGNGKPSISGAGSKKEGWSREDLVQVP